MKVIDILCASQASTAICSNLEQRSLIRQGSKSGLLEEQGSRALNRSNSLTEQIRRALPRRSTERRPSNADQNARGNEPSPTGGIEVEERRSMRRSSSNSISRFSCSAIDDLPIAPYQRSAAPKAAKKCPVVNNDPLPSSSLSSKDATEVVVLRVSLHCQGCAGKVRKHISKMEGVTSFNIDLPEQKVTVVGNVTPLEVLQSISRVKNAEIWSSSENND